MALAHRTELVLYHAYAGLRAEAARNYIYFAWWVLEPLLFMGAFYLLFAVLLNQGTENYVAFLLIGLAVWKWFGSAVQHAAGSILYNPGLMRQIYLPKILFPLSTVVMDSVKFLCVLVVLLIFLWAYGVGPSESWLALPLLLAVQLLLVVACACLAAAVTPFLPDLRLVIENLLLMLMLVSGIFFEASQVPAEFRGYLDWNPMAVLIEAFRDCLLHGRWPRLQPLLGVVGWALGFLLVAVLLLRRYDRRYPRLALE